MADEAFPLPGVSTISTLAEWEQIFGGMSTSGVVSGVGSELAPNLNSGARTAIIASGGALLQGFFKPVSSATGTAIPAANTQNRIDRLVLRLNRAAAAAADFVKPAVITGTPSGTPQPPAITQTTSGLWDLPICRWTSASSGALSGLVDERQILGSLVVACTSTNRPVNPKIGMLGYETDTGRWIGWTGSQPWRVLYEDTGDVSLPVSSSTVWEVRSPGLIGRKRNGLVTVEINVKRIGTFFNGDSSDDSTGSRLTTLPAGLRPTREIYAPVVLSGGIFGRIRYQQDGGVYVQTTSADIGVGRFVRFCHSFQVA
jgi:hypothetical protein